MVVFVAIIPEIDEFSINSIMLSKTSLDSSGDIFKKIGIFVLISFTLLFIETIKLFNDLYYVNLLS